MAIPPDLEIIPTRQTLLVRLKDANDNESWKEFFELYWKLIYMTAKRAGLRDDEAKDVVQETILTLAKSIPDFTYDPKVGSFKGYLLTLTSWRIADQYRKRLPEPLLTHNPYPGTDTVESLPDPNGFVPEEYWNEEWERNLLEVARERVKSKVNPKHYQIFDLNVDQGWPAHKVAQTLRVSSAKVYLVRHRISRLLQKEVKELQAGEEKRNENHRQ